MSDFSLEALGHELEPFFARYASPEVQNAQSSDFFRILTMVFHHFGWENLVEKVGPLSEDFSARKKSFPEVVAEIRRWLVPGPQKQERFYGIRIQPSPTIFQQGLNIPLMFQELAKLGELTVLEADTKGLPDWNDFDPKRCYLNWNLTLKTERTQDEVRDALIFFECDPGTSVDVRENVVRNPAAVKRNVERTETAKIVEGENDQETIRIPASKLDRLVNLVGELVSSQAKLTQASSSLKNLSLESISEEMELLVNELRDNAVSLRMVPVKTLFKRFTRLVRDLSHDLGKEVRLVLEGEETEFDKSVIEHLYDPIVHLIRNSMDHGFETAEKRTSAGKPAEGTITLTASQSGPEVLIGATDDGAGIDPERVLKKAIERGIVSADAKLSESEILQLIFLPGFSTAETVSGISGRGVGMDVVKTNVEKLRGKISIETALGKGTKIVMHFPLTLAIIDGLLVRVGNETYIVPLSLVDECLEFEPEGSNSRQRMLDLRGHWVPYIDLRESLCSEKDETEKKYTAVLVKGSDGDRVGLVVDSILGQYQTVIKPLGPLHSKNKEYSGATILGDGTVALIFDVPYLITQSRSVLQEV